MESKMKPANNEEDALESGRAEDDEEVEALKQLVDDKEAARRQTERALRELEAQLTNLRSEIERLKL
jgi:chromosome segregation ATPase